MRQNAAPLLLTTAALLRQPLRRSLPMNAVDTLEALSSELPFLTTADLLSEDVEYTGLGLTLSGRDACMAAASCWSASLPERLRDFTIEDLTVLPPDGRGIVYCRYRISFDAPVPPAVLPGQRRRLAAAQLTIKGGRTRVSALVAANLQLDGDGRCRKFRETLVADPFAVETSIAHFELLNARAIALEPLSSKTPLVREPLAYVSALRGMMRLELEEAKRRSRSDELSVLEVDDGVSDDEFEAQFRVYMLRIFALGFMPGAAAFALAKLLRAAVDGIGATGGML